MVSTAAAAGTLSWMSGEDAGEMNSFEEPRRVGVREKAVELQGGGTVLLQLPPWSVSVLTVARV